MEPQSQAVEVEDEREWELRDEELDRGAGEAGRACAPVFSSRPL